MNGVSVAPEITGWTADAIARVVGFSPTQVTAGSKRHEAALRTARAAITIDEQLFRPGVWLMLDSGNAVVPGVRPGTLRQAVELVGQGPIRSFFGRLRPGVAVVDIDMVRSSAALMAVVGWAAERDLWHLVRPSGRRGHHHVFIVVGAQWDALEDFAERLRLAEGVSRSRIDVRDAVRPLSAPHRCEQTPELANLALPARRLPKALRGLPGLGAGTQTTGHPAGPPSKRSGTRDRAAPAITRRRIGLPTAWQQYLSHAVVPPQVRSWSDGSRSAVESTATYQMVLAGWSADQAWLAITTCHRGAMAKARGRGRGWWVAHVWNPAVTAAAQAAAPSPAPPVIPEIDLRDSAASPDAPLLAHQVARLRAAFLATWDSYGRDRRHTLRFVLETVLDRMLRSGSRIVPCPERDLVVDTGISSRRLLREALRELDAHGWLVLHRSFAPGSSSPEHLSHHVSLPAELPRIPLQALLVPPSSFTPLPLVVRAALGPTLWHTWTALPSHPAATPALSRSAGSGASPTRAQLQVLRARLTRLAGLGLAQVDAEGRWRALDLSGLDPAFAERAKLALAERVAHVTGERAEYDLLRSGVLRRRQLQQAAATRAAAARELAARRWWSQLPEPERRARRQRYAARFASLSVPEQMQVKHQFAARRAAAGAVSEEAVRQAWMDSLSPQEYTSRVIERTLSYRSLPAPLQVAKAAGWAAHRARWGLNRDAAPPPQVDTNQARGTRYEALEQLELITLADLLDRDPDGRLSGMQGTQRPAVGWRA